MPSTRPKPTPSWAGLRASLSPTGWRTPSTGTCRTAAGGSGSAPASIGRITSATTGLDDHAGDRREWSGGQPARRAAPPRGGARGGRPRGGGVGGRLVERLAAAGERVAATGRGPRRDALRGVEYVDLDLRNAGKLGELIESLRPRSVLHAAGMTDGAACEGDPVGAWALNVRAVEEGAAACRSVGARLIALSTDYVFDGERGPYGEDDAPNPRGVYARTERAGEEAALLLATDRAVCRLAGVYRGRRGYERSVGTS